MTICTYFTEAEKLLFKKETSAGLRLSEAPIHSPFGAPSYFVMV
jgi:hypothetical protein